MAVTHDRRRRLDYSPAELLPWDEAPVLTPRQIDEFQRDGYVIAPEMYPRNRVDEIGRWTDELAEAPEAPGRHWVYREASVRDPNERVLQRIENFCPVHPGFDRLLSGGELVPCVEQLLGG